MSAPAHLFVEVSAHGFGHLAQVAPVLNVLVKFLPDLRITLRSGLPRARVQARVDAVFAHRHESTDFGYVMHDAVSINLAATADAYRAAHAHWDERVAREAQWLADLRPKVVLSDVAYLPLAGAAQAGIPSFAMCSLNWADLFAHFFGGAFWAPTIHRQMLAAYNSTQCFLRLTPGMAMTDLLHWQTIGPVAALGRDRHQALREELCCASSDRLILIAFGGVDKQVPIRRWPKIEGIRWLVPESWRTEHPDVLPLEAAGLSFPDLLRSVDAVVTKPGYGTFAEAACNGTPVLYVRRADWPEQDCLIAWLRQHARCRELTEAELVAGDFEAKLTGLWQEPVVAAPQPSGAEEVAAWLLPWLSE